MKNSGGALRSATVLLFVLACIFSVVIAFYNLQIFLIEVAILVIYAIIMLLRFRGLKQDAYSFLNHMEQMLDSANRQSLQGFPLPVCVLNEMQEIIWYNDLFRFDVLYGEEAFGKQSKELFPEIDITQASNEHGVDVVFSDRMYTLHVTESTENDSRLYILYFIDNTELKQLSAQYFKTRPSIALIVIDNYDELLQDVKESQKVQMIGQIEYLLEKYIGESSAFIRKFEKDKFIAVLEEQHLRHLIEGRFAVLDQVRRIITNERMSATLSIGIGQDCSTLHESERVAKQALDMALGRGGDQVAIKNKNGYEFYGGVSKGVEKRTKVRSRMIAAALAELVEGSDTVFIMGHRFADLDCLGASIGLYRAVTRLSRQAFICVDKDKNLSQNLIERMEANGYSQAFIAPQDAVPLVTPKTMLIIVDTHNPNFLESLELYRACKTVAIIDHHRKMVGHIDNAVIFYHEPYASSASEMVAELTQYLGENVNLTRIEAEALLAGIMLDTKNFVLKTGVRTFEAAAYLRRMGADTVEVRRLFANSMDSYQTKSKLVASAEIYMRCAISIAITGSDDLRIVAPQAADELLYINGVDASFVMYEVQDGVSISARSMGAVNVQVIMEELGGGGHHTMAGAQIPESSCENVKQLLLDAIGKYFEERDQEA